MMEVALGPCVHERGPRKGCCVQLRPEPGVMYQNLHTQERASAPTFLTHEVEASCCVRP